MKQQKGKNIQGLTCNWLLDDCSQITESHADLTGFPHSTFLLYYKAFSLPSSQPCLSGRMPFPVTTEHAPECTDSFASPPNTEKYSLISSL